MIMTKEDFCSYEVAKLLKEKGFDETCYACYEYFSSSITMYSGWPFEYKGEVVNSSKDRIKCPTHQMAMKWLREEHKIMITIIPQEVNVGVDRMCYAIYRITEDLYQPLYNGKVDSLVDSYEETVEAALKYCLENLI